MFKTWRNIDYGDARLQAANRMGFDDRDIVDLGYD